MIDAPVQVAPSPTRSALLGFLSRVQPGQRYAIYPAGRYTLACLEDLPPQCLHDQGRRFIGLIDDNPTASPGCDHAVAPLDEAARHWKLDAIIVTRDTHRGDLIRRIGALQNNGPLGRVNVITQPDPTLAAMTAHLGSYHPGCDHEPQFVDACRSAEAANDHPAGSTLLCTLDAEVFAGADAQLQARYAPVVRELCELLADRGFSASLCVQLTDSPGTFLRTPDAVVEAVLDTFGAQTIELHGLDHSMPVEGYSAEWFEHGLDLLQTRYGATANYWAPPGWTLCWRTLATLQGIPKIRAIRGLCSGPNRIRRSDYQTFRFPYAVNGQWQIPYSYVDWMFMEVDLRRCDPTQITPAHQHAARSAAQRPCLMETVAHPFRLVGAEPSERRKILEATLDAYASCGVRIASVAQGLSMLDEASPTTRRRFNSGGRLADTTQLGRP